MAYVEAVFMLLQVICLMVFLLTVNGWLLALANAGGRSFILGYPWISGLQGFLTYLDLPVRVPKMDDVRDAKKHHPLGSKQQPLGRCWYIYHTFMVNVGTVNIPVSFVAFRKNSHGL